MSAEALSTGSRTPSGGGAAASVGPWRWIAVAGGIVGPVAFALGWVVFGAIRPGYNPVHQTISQLARTGAPHRLGMTVAFVVFGLGLLAFSPVVGKRFDSRWLTVSTAVAGAATLAVAAFPLSRANGTPEDLRHELSALIGYVGCGVSPWLAVPALRRAKAHWALAASVVLALVALVTLICTHGPAHPGLFQRAGLTAVDLWWIGAAIGVARGYRGSQPPKQPTA